MFEPPKKSRQPSGHFGLIGPERCRHLSLAFGNQLILRRDWPKCRQMDARRCGINGMTNSLEWLASFWSSQPETGQDRKDTPNKQPHTLHIYIYMYAHTPLFGKCSQTTSHLRPDARPYLGKAPPVSRTPLLEAVSVGTPVASDPNGSRKMRTHSSPEA